MLEGSEVRDRADPVLVEMGTGSLREERTKKSPPRGPSWLGVDDFFFLCRCRWGAWRPDALLTPDVRARAVPFLKTKTKENDWDNLL